MERRPWTGLLCAFALLLLTLLGCCRRSQDGLYPLLLKFIDVKGVGEELPMLALDLLAVLPTYPHLTHQLAAALEGSHKQQQLAAALQGSHKQQQLAALLDTNSDAMQQGGAGAAPELTVGDPMPYRTLYALQTLCALLFPTFDESLLQPAADAEAMAEASACPSPVAGPGQGPGQLAPPSAAAAAAATCNVQHHREQQQQEFLQSRGLEVVLAAAQSAANANQTDLKLRRQLSELLVMLLHNLIDAAQGWANQAAAGSWDLMSGAESGAGAGAVTTAAAAGESGVASMAAVGGAISSKDSQQAEPDPQQQQDAASPSMEDAASSPAQPLAAPVRLAQPQAQQPKPGSGKQQRHRAAELPPLPPVPGPAATQGGTAATCQQGLALVFGAHTLKLMAFTLLTVAVDTSQLWGTDSQPFPDDDSSRDVAVVKDAMQLLLRLLEQQPMLVQHLLLEAASSPLVTVVLVNPHYSSLRKQVSGLTMRPVLACSGFCVLYVCVASVCCGMQYMAVLDCLRPPLTRPTGVLFLLLHWCVDAGRGAAGAACHQRQQPQTAALAADAAGRSQAHCTAAAWQQSGVL